MPQASADIFPDVSRRDFVKAASAWALGSTLAKAQTPTDQNPSPSTDSRDRFLKHRFGVNYVPSQKWYFSYNDWHLSEIERDLDSIARLEADHIRVFVIWPWFQPNPKYVSPAHLDRLDELMTAARERGLDVLPAVFTGWYGYRFNPHFYEQEPFYTSPKWAAAQERFVRSLAERLRHHPNFIGFDFGSEINWNWQAKSSEGDPWMRKTFALMRALCPDQVHVNGVDHQPWFKEDTFSPEALFAEQSVVPIHCWPHWVKAREHGGPTDPAYTLLPAAMGTLARSLGGDATKPIWLQEFGSCPVDMPEKQIPAWLEQAVQRASANGIGWITWWCSHDVDPTLDFDPFEFELGLVTRDQRLKETGHHFRALARQFRGMTVRPPASIPPPPAIRSHDASWKWIMDWTTTQPSKF